MARDRMTGGGGRMTGSRGREASPVTVSSRGSVAVVTLDDGHDNVADLEAVRALLGAFRTLQNDSGAVVLAGRPGCYSVGLDMEILRAGGEAASELLHSSTELILHMAEFPRPLVTACTGRALGAAAVALLCCDVRVGAAGDYEIGMDYVTAGLPVPDLALELARSRLSTRHVTMACNTARLYSPEEAVDAGYLDFVTTRDPVERACRVADDLAQRLDPKAFKATRVRTCRRLTEAIMRSAGDLWRMGLSGADADD